MIHAVIELVNGIVGGGESSPLSVNSTYAELMRLIQTGLFLGMLYIIKMLKNNHHSNDTAHGEVINDIQEMKKQIKELTDSVAQITKGGPVA